MARNHFAIERPRKISISIQGYDAQAVTKAQQKKRLESSKRQQRKGAAAQSAPPASAGAAPAAATQPRPTPAKANAPAQPRADDDEIEALSRAAAGPEQCSSDDQLRQALAGDALEKGAHHADE